MEIIRPKTLYTKRLILRPFIKGDEVFMFSNWASDEEVTKYLRWQTHKTLQDSKKYIENCLQESEGDYKLAIVLKGTNEPIGSIGLFTTSLRDDVCEIGYALGKSFWNKGYTTEAAKEIIRFAFCELKANRVEGLHAVENKASGRVMEKCGMKKEGTLRQSYKSYRFGYLDSNIYAILREDYERQTRK